MTKIGVIGHSPDSFPNIKSITRDIDDAIAIIKRQHIEQDFVFLLNCEPGVGQWFCNALIEQLLSYEIYLSTIPEKASIYWSDAQQECFLTQLNNAKGIHSNISDKDFGFRKFDPHNYRNYAMIDDSQWVIVFWNGKHQGFTYRAMEYAIKNNKIVYNAIGGLKIIDGTALKLPNKNID